MKLLDLPKVIKVEHVVEPTWSSNTGRNSNSGKFNGTFVGYFDTLKVYVGKTNQSEMTKIKREIEKPIISSTFIDSNDGNEKTEDFYGTAINASTNNTKRRYEPFSFSLKAVERRSDL